MTTISPAKVVASALPEGVRPYSAHRELLAEATQLLESGAILNYSIHTFPDSPYMYMGVQLPTGGWGFLVDVLPPESKPEPEPPRRFTMDDVW
jgi:hypothetical protein